MVGLRSDTADQLGAIHNDLVRFGIVDGLRSHAARAVPVITSLIVLRCAWAARDHDDVHDRNDHGDNAAKPQATLRARVSLRLLLRLCHVSPDFAVLLRRVGYCAAMSVYPFSRQALIVDVGVHVSLGSIDRAVAEFALEVGRSGSVSRL